MLGLLMRGTGSVGSIIPVTDGNVLKGLSPYNWVCRDNSISSTVNGASLSLRFTGTQRVALRVNTDSMETRIPTRFPIIAWSVNGGTLQTHQLAAREDAVLLSSGVADPRIELYIKGMSPFEDRYSGDVPGNAVRITGFAVDQGGSTRPSTLPGKIWLNIGDSILSGDGAAYAAGQGRPPDDGWAASEDGRASYGYLLARHYGYREARIAYGGYDWGGGMAHLPSLSELIDRQTSTTSRLHADLLSPAPNVALINLGENGAPAEADVTQALGKLRSRVGPGCKILVMIPVSGRARAEVTRAFNSYNDAARDEAAFLIDLGQVTFATCDGQHPTAVGHEAIYAAALPALDPILGKSEHASRAKTDGFLSPVTGREVVRDSAPVSVKLLARTTTPRDTLDPVLMAKWALNYLTGSVSEEQGFASSYGNWPLKMPPFAIGGDRIAIGDSEVRNALAFVLMREMSGIAYGARVQKGVWDRILSYQLPCGLFNPMNHGDTDVLWATAWMTRALIEEYATTGNRKALSRAAKALKAVRRYAVDANGQGLLRLAPPEKLTLDGQEIRFAYRPVLDFCIVEPFVRYYEVTGDQEMLTIARGLVEGRLQGYARGHDTTHTHSYWHSLIGIAHLGAVTGEQKVLDWVESQFERWIPSMTDYGWFEAIANYNASETCAVSDLMHVCIYLGRGGHSLRYDLVERTLRNYLPREQFFIDDRFLQLWRQQTYADRDQQMALMRRLEGGFLCRTTPSDRWALPGAPEGPISLEGCCPPTGMTGLYLAWKEIVRKTNRGVFVNLAFNHDSPEATVVSFLPDQGRLTVTPKHAGAFYMRIPGFAPREQVQAWRNGRRCRNVVWMGDYVTFASAQKGEELTVTYPLVTGTQKVRRAGTDYTFHWKGNAVTGIEPAGGVWPLFEKIPYPTPPFPRPAPAP
jgi:hypothetical protein